MKVFVSSLIGGYESYRDAVVEAAEMLGHTVLRAEDLGATPASPQQACLGLVRDSDVVVLLIGEHYGAVQPSGLSATHEEYREAHASGSRCSCSWKNPRPGRAASRVPRRGSGLGDGPLPQGVQ